MDIKSVIKEHGFTQKQVADAMGVTESSMSQTVNNENVSIKMLHRIADVIGCKVGDFFKDEMEHCEPCASMHKLGKFTCPHCGQEITIMGVTTSPDTLL